MSDLLQSQIKESCELALPDGLKELMSDISREQIGRRVQKEAYSKSDTTYVRSYASALRYQPKFNIKVLRAQPTNVYEFISKYLAVLMVTREHLSVGVRLCRDICEPSCHPELKEQLANIGLDEEDAMVAVDIIMRHFWKGKGNEKSLMMKLLTKTNIVESQLESVQEAIREAFLQHQMKKIDDKLHEIPPETDDATIAANHTLKLYAETGPSEYEYNQKAQRIQTAYRAYGFCRSKSSKERKKSIRFDSQGQATEIPTNHEDSDVPKPSAVYFDPIKLEDTDETQLSQTEKPQLHHGNQNKSGASILSEIHFKPLSRTSELIDIHNRDDISVKEEKEFRSTFFSDVVIFKSSDVDIDRYNQGDTDKQSDEKPVSEVRFSEPVVYEFAQKETDESKTDKLLPKDLDTVDIDMEQSVDDHTKDEDKELEVAK